MTASSYRRRLVIKTKCTESKGISALIGAFCCFDVQNKTKGTPEGVPSAYMMIDINLYRGRSNFIVPLFKHSVKLFVKVTLCGFGFLLYLDFCQLVGKLWLVGTLAAVGHKAVC